MRATYSTQIIKNLVNQHEFAEYRKIIESGYTLPYADLTFVPKHDVNKFLNFVEKLIFLSKEYRLDYIESIDIDFSEIIFLDELGISTAVE